MVRLALIVASVDILKIDEGDNNVGVRGETAKTWEHDNTVRRLTT